MPAAQARLLFLGLVSAVVYSLAFTSQYWLPRHHLRVQDELFAYAASAPWRGVVFYAALALLFLLYAAAWRLCARDISGHLKVWPIALWSLVFCLLLIPVKSITSSDIYGYVFQARIAAVLRENPFAHLYSEFAGDSFYFCVTFHNLPASTGYGPVWIAIESGVGWLARDRLLLNLVLLKTLAAGLHLGSAALVYAALGTRTPQERLAGTVFYAWNPLLLYELAGNGHNDAAVALLALAGFFVLGRGRWWAAVPCLALSALVKPVGVLWLPIAAVWVLVRCSGWRSRAWHGLGIVALAVLPAVLFYAPFWVGAATFQGVLAQSDIYGNSLPNLVVQVLSSWWPDAQSQVLRAVKLVGALAFAPFYLWRLLGARREPIRPAFDVMLFYLLFVGFQFMPWYAAWIMVPAAMLPDPPLGVRQRGAFLLCLAAPLLYFPFGWQWARASLSGPWIALFSALPVIGLAAWLVVRYLRKDS